jgi:hypothetical protein
MPFTTSLLLATTLLGSSATVDTRASEWSAVDDQSQNDRLREVMAGSTGTPGFFVRELGGPIHAGYNSTRVFEPASSIKVLAHLYAMRKVDKGTAELRDRIGIYPTPTTCAAAPTETLRTALQKMMQVSDNDRTRAVVDLVGRTNINNMATNLGFGKLKWKRAMECEVPDQNENIRNEMTLVDGAKLYEGVLRGQLIEKPALRRTFWELMAGHSLGATIDEELAAAGLSASAKASYKARVRGASKGGWWPGKGRGSELGWIRIPVCDGGKVESKTFLYGFFVDDGNADPGDGSGPVAKACNRARKELMREQFRASARTWSACASAPADADDASAPRPAEQAPPSFQPM